MFYIFLLSTCADELLSALNIIRFLPNPTHGTEKLPYIKNEILYPDQKYLSWSRFVVNFAVQNNKGLKTKLISVYNGHDGISKTIYKFILSLIVKTH